MTNYSLKSLKTINRTGGAKLRIDHYELSAHRISANLDNAGDANNGSNQFDHVWRLIGNDEILPETIEDDLQDRPNEVEEDG
jgi:hypothetical protein